MREVYKLLFILATEIVRVVITSKFAVSFMDKSEESIKRILAYSASVVLTTTEYYFFNVSWLNLLSTLVGLIIITIPYYGKLKKKIQFVLYVLSISCILDLCVYALLSSTFDYENYSTPASILSLFFLLIVQLITKRVLAKNKSEELSSPHWWRYIVSLVTCIAASLVVIMDKSISPWSLSAVCGAFLFINLIVVYLFEDLIKTKQNEYENLILSDQARAYEKELSMQQENVDAIRTYRHDMKHHLLAMRVMNKEGKVDELDRYIVQVSEDLSEIEPIAYTGNVGVDGVLNYMLQKAKYNGIDVQLHVVIPEDLDIPVFDMNIILGNLIENAIEANECVDKPRIDILMKYVKNALLIEISNTHVNTIDLINNEMVSTKQDKTTHGYGIRNVRKVLSKYEHSLVFEENEDIFVVRVMLRKK
ncbi:MAG: sensor histidine kinase [Clostridiales bacterium]|nr:sensor histidine kinase [Clostridiales bacterium]